MDYFVLEGPQYIKNNTWEGSTSVPLSFFAKPIVTKTSEFYHSVASLSSVNSLHHNCNEARYANVI